MRRRAQAGMILPALLMLVLIGALALAFGRLGQALSSHTRQHQQTVDALAQARQILRDHAQSYHLTHAGESVGYLPCPDMDNDGSSELSCGSAGDYAIGRLPYRTLGSLPLRDGYGECLWYVVAGAFKNNPKVADAFNWDTSGQFIVRTVGGHALHPAARATDHAAALIIAPGPPTSTQHRSAGNAPCNGNDTAALAISAFLEGGYVPTGSAPVIVVQGRVGSDANNDQIAWLAASDIFDASLARRSDFKAKIIDDMLGQLATAAQGTPFDADQHTTLIDGVEVGPPPKDAVTGNIAPHWQDQFRFLRCTDGTQCMLTASGASCEEVLLFAGAATALQDRGASADESDYFEDNVSTLSSPPAPSLFTGADSYVADTPSRDLVRCLL